MPKKNRTESERVNDRIQKNLCLKCGNFIDKQTYRGSLCEGCNEKYFEFEDKEYEKGIDVEKHNTETFRKFLQSRTTFVFR